VGKTHRLEGQRPHKFPKINLKKPNNFFGEEIRDIKLAKSNSETHLPITGNIEKYQKRRLFELNQINKQNINHKILHQHSEYTLEDSDILSHISPHHSQIDKYITLAHNQHYTINNTSTISTHSTQSQSNSSLDTSKRLLNSKNVMPLVNMGGKCSMNNSNEKSMNNVQGTLNTKRDSFINQHSNDSFESKINT